MEKIFNRNKSVVMFGALGLSAILLAGCSSVELKVDKPATVLKHEYHPPYYTIIPSGKVVVPVYHPAEYLLDLQQCGREDVKEADSNGCVQIWERVDQETYESTRDGQSIVFHSHDS